MTHGPVMLDVSGKHLTDADKRRLEHPLTGGMILFSRNFESPGQLASLIGEIRHCRPDILIAVDHEGGRVQRFRSGFTRLPPMRLLGQLHDADPTRAMDLAQKVGLVLAAELRAFDIDLSFTPDLDVDYGVSAVIGDRSFHADPATIATLAASLQQGLRDGGMQSCGKHFPGHGFVEADSHVAVPVDERDFDTILAQDLLPFLHLAEQGMGSVMPAHVIYPKVDSQCAGFSRIWLQEVLRGMLKFDGAIFSDDLNMEGARAAGSILERAELALEAGCDMILVCNNPAAADTVLQNLRTTWSPSSQHRIEKLRGTRTLSRTSLIHDAGYRTAQAAVARLVVDEQPRDAADIVGNL